MENDPRIGKIISHYKITGVLGGGGMGVVYKAEDINLKRTVALKFLALNLVSNEQTKTRFKYEARAASALDHPRVGTIYQIGETEQGEMYIAMAYYEGDTLKDRMAQKKISEKQAIKYTCQIASGLAAAHEKGIVHRDVKPANIIITKDGFVKIVDFGLAKLGDSTRITTEGTSMGTPAYMSPEQAKGLEADNRSDIWSLGVILYELLTGELPFFGADSMSLMFNIVNTPSRLLNEINSDLKPGYQKILDKALAKKKEERYSDLKEMIDDLKSVDKLSEPAADEKDTVILSADDKETRIIPEKKSAPPKAQSRPPKRKSKARILVPVVVALLVLFYIIFKMQSGPVGFLEIESDPSDASIQLNGQTIASKTPTVLGLEEGKYKVSVKMDGFESFEKEFTVTAGDTISHEFGFIRLEETAVFIISSVPPGAVIFVDGQNTGKVTPTSVNDIEPGKHDVELRLAGYKNTVTTLVAVAGDSKPWSPNLQKQVAVAQKRNVKKPKQKILKPATLFVDSKPQGADIFLNGRNSGKTTPHRFEDRMPGIYLVQLYLNGYKDHKEQVTLSSGENEKIKRDLKQKEKGELRIQAFDDTGSMRFANVYIDGKPYDQTPKIITLPEGVYVVEAKLFEFGNQKKKVTVKSGKKETVKFTFKK